MPFFWRPYCYKIKFTGWGECIVGGTTPGNGICFCHNVNVMYIFFNELTAICHKKSLCACNICEDQRT